MQIAGNGRGASLPCILDSASNGDACHSRRSRKRVWLMREWRLGQRGGVLHRLELDGRGLQRLGGAIGDWLADTASGSYN